MPPVTTDQTPHERRVAAKRADPSHASARRRAHDADLDGIVIGAGQHGLILAAYLSRAGLKVAALERRPEEGGAISTWESAPGVFHNLATHFKMHDGPITRDLQLDRYGVDFLYPELKTAVPGDGDRNPLLHFSADPDRTAASIAAFSARDADTFRQMFPVWNEWYERFVLPQVYRAPEPGDDVRARIAAEPGGDEYLRVTGLPPDVWLSELFETDLVRALLLWMSNTSTYRAGGMSTMAMHAFLSWLVRRTAIVRGGSRQIARGLTRLITSHGGQVVTNAHVTEILVDGGRAAGVRLNDGRTIGARRFVASAVDVKQTLLDLVDDRHLGGPLLDRIRAFRLDDSSLFGVHLVLSEPIRYRVERAVPVVAGALRYIVGLDGTEDLVTEREAARTGNLPEGRLIVMTGNPSRHDPTLARPGAYTAYAWVMVPARLRTDGVEGWDAIAEETADRAIESWALATDNLSARTIVHRRLTTPLELQRSFINMVDGGINMGLLSPDQSGVNRPAPELSSYRTPIEALYLCGSSSHPGGQLTGANGYNAARAIAEDLGVEPWWPEQPRIGAARSRGE
jgi:phytoene dehydrogenase-like protein